MIAYLKGALTLKTPTYVLIEAGGVGYHVNISLHTYSQIEKLEQTQLWIHTHHNLQEGSQSLYGFFDSAERSIFTHLISVNGVGANTARIVLSGLSPDEVRAAILGDNELIFNKIKGIGPKTAKRIIIELKDKMMKHSDGDGGTVIALAGKNNLMREEAITALVALGFIRTNVQKAMNAILTKDPNVPNVETLIKMGLKQLTN
jgi:Holliday junction DNA helicase RuvA